MNRFRIFILVLLAVLLPLRGAVAASMQCPGSDDPVTVQAAAAPEHLDTLHAPPVSADDTADPCDASSHSGEHPVNCHLCASSCCMASLVDNVPFVGQPGPPSPVTFPTLAAPLPTFLSGGQDRPPRTV